MGVWVFAYLRLLQPVALGQRCRTFAWVLTAGMLLSLRPSTSLAQATLSVSAGTRIEAHTEQTREGHLWIRGVLRDDLGSPLGEQRVSIEFDGAQLSTITEPSGVFALDLGVRNEPEPENASQIKVAFNGSTHLSATRASITSAARAPAISIEATIHPSSEVLLGAGTYTVDATPTSSNNWSPSGQVLLILRNEAGDELARQRVALGDTAHLKFIASDAGAPGYGRLTITGAAPGGGEATRTEIPIVRMTTAKLRLSASREGNEIRFDGAMSTAHADPGSVPLDLVDAKGKLLATLLTQNDGSFAGVLAGEAGQAKSVQATFRATAGIQSARSPLITPDANIGNLGNIGVALVAGLLGLALLIAFFFFERAPTSPASSALRRLPALARRGIAARVTRVSGQVLDVYKQPIANATVSLDGQQIRTDAAGTFAFAECQAGTHQLHIEHSDARTEHIGVRVPHRGEYQGLEITLVSLREAVLADFQNALVESGISETDARHTTPRQAWVALAARFKWIKEEAPRTERAVFGPDESQDR